MDRSGIGENLRSKATYILFTLCTFRLDCVFGGVCMHTQTHVSSRAVWTGKKVTQQTDMSVKKCLKLFNAVYYETP